MPGASSRAGMTRTAVVAGICVLGLGLLALAALGLRGPRGGDGSVGPSGAPAPGSAGGALAGAEATEQPVPLGEQVAMELARGFVLDFQQDRLVELYEHCTLGFAAETPLEELRALRARVADQLGAEAEVVGERVTIQGAFAIYYRVARYDRQDGLVELSLALNPKRLIAGFRIRVGETRPAEVSPPS